MSRRATIRVRASTLEQKWIEGKTFLNFQWKSLQKRYCCHYHCSICYTELLFSQWLWLFLLSFLFTVCSSTCSKRSNSNLNITNEEQAEGKPTQTDMPLDTLPPLEGTTDQTTAANEPQDKEKAKKTKNNKGGKTENTSGNAQESPPPAGSQKAIPVLNNKKPNFRNQYVRLPSNLPMRSAACSLLWEALKTSPCSLTQNELTKPLYRKNPKTTFSGNFKDQKPNSRALKCHMRFDLFCRAVDNSCNRYLWKFKLHLTPVDC